MASQASCKGVLPPVADLRRVEAEYITVAGWEEDISMVREESELPATAQQYLALIEKELGVPITLLSVGADRDATLIRKPIF